MAISKIGNAGLPTGLVLQVVSSTKTNYFNTTSTSYVDIDGTDQSGGGSVFCVKITPASTIAFPKTDSE